MKPRPEHVTVTSLSRAPSTPFQDGRGTQISLFDPERGAQNLDVHVNVLKKGTSLGRYHVHNSSENIYLVLEGLVELVAEQQSYRLSEGDAAFIPPGVPHRAGVHLESKVDARLLEIYAPPGPDFHVVESPDEEGATTW